MDSWINSMYTTNARETEFVRVSSSTTRYLRNEFEELALGSGSSLTVFKHRDPTRVWIVSFDLARYKFYKLLGMDVGVERMEYVLARECWDESLIVPHEVSIFDCERLKEPDEDDPRFKRIERILDNDEYSDEFLLPQQIPELQALFYAIKALQAEGYDFAMWDRCPENCLERADSTLFLSDMFFWEDSFSPEDTYLDLNSVRWLPELLGIPSHEWAD